MESMKGKNKIVCGILLIVCIILVCVISGLKIKKYHEIKFYEKTYVLNNTGNNYEEQLRNIHDTYPPEFYEYVNESDVFQQEFVYYEDEPENKSWTPSLLPCKGNNSKSNILCYSHIAFGEAINFNMAYYPARGNEDYSINFKLIGNEFTSFEVQSSDRMGAYAICTFNDAELTEPVNKIEKYDEPDYDEYPMSPYGEVNCYEEGKLYQDIVPLLEELEKKTMEKMKKLIELSEKYKNLSDEEVQELRDNIRLVE